MLGMLYTDIQTVRRDSEKLWHKNGKKNNHNDD